MTHSMTLMTLKSLKSLTIALALAAPLTAAFAQATAPAASAAAPLPTSPAKKALVQKLLKLQQDSIDGLARQLAESPASQLMQGAANALQQQNLPADKRDALWKDIQADIKKYADEAVPLVRERAEKLAPSVLGPVLEEKFTEEELRQLVTWLESPARRKFEQFAPDMQKQWAEKIVADTRPQIEPKLRALQATIGKRLGLQPQPAASGPAAAPAGNGLKKK